MRSRGCFEKVVGYFFLGYLYCVWVGRVGREGRERGEWDGLKSYLS